MPTHTKHRETKAFYFCTLTCFKWLPLFQKTQLYDNIEQWFAYINKYNAYIVAYVIMPNHLHFIIYLDEATISLNKMIANAKRFWAYEIVKRLKLNGATNLLQQLQQGVQANEKKKGKLHQVFRLSFDAKDCYNKKMFEQKLDYIHLNPVSGKWNLAENYLEYLHSSAGFYEAGDTKPDFFNGLS